LSKVGQKLSLTVNCPSCPITPNFDNCCETMTFFSKLLGKTKTAPSASSSGEELAPAAVPIIGSGTLSSFERVWEYREETLYPKLFGESSQRIYPLDFELFEKVFPGQAIDPGWLHLGVFEFRPTASRKSWLYVTSGASTPWEVEPADYDSDGYSWLGVEFVMETVEQAEWPIHVLRRLLAYHVLVCHERFGDIQPLDYGHRVPAGGPIDWSDNSKLTFLAIAKPAHYQASAQLESGRFDFLHVVGITEQERDYAKSTSTAALIEKMEVSGAFPVTLPKRDSILI